MALLRYTAASFHIVIRVRVTQAIRARLQSSIRQTNWNFPFYDILLRHRKEDGEDNIIRFPRALKAFINAKADEEDAIQNGITGYQEHQSKSNKQIGQW